MSDYIVNPIKKCQNLLTRADFRGGSPGTFLKKVSDRPSIKTFYAVKNWGQSRVKPVGPNSKVDRTKIHHLPYLQKTKRRTTFAASVGAEEEAYQNIGNMFPLQTSWLLDISKIFPFWCVSGFPFVLKLVWVVRHFGISRSGIDPGLLFTCTDCITFKMKNPACDLVEWFSETSQQLAASFGYEQ